MIDLLICTLLHFGLLDLRLLDVLGKTTLGRRRTSKVCDETRSHYQRPSPWDGQAVTEFQFSYTTLFFHPAFVLRRVIMLHSNEKEKDAHEKTSRVDVKKRKKENDAIKKTSRIDVVKGLDAEETNRWFAAIKESIANSRLHQ